MIDFGQLSKVEKTYTKENVTPRGQAYEGIKFRRSESKAGKAEGEEGEIDSKFTFSNKLWSALELDNHGFVEFTDGQRDDKGAVVKVEKVFLALVADTHEDAKILKATKKGDKKSRAVRVQVLEQDLVQAGILDGTKMDNQYLTLEKSDGFSNVPAHIKGIYAIVVDSSVNEAEVEEEEEVAVAPASNDNDF